jgi:hypothetical protein
VISIFIVGAAGGAAAGSVVHKGVYVAVCRENIVDQLGEAGSIIVTAVKSHANS